MEELLIFLVLASLALMLSAVGQWVYAGSLGRRLSGARKRLQLLEGQHAKWMDYLSGRLGVLEAQGTPTAAHATPPRASEGAAGRSIQAGDHPAPRQPDAKATKSPVEAAGTSAASSPHAPGTALDALRRAKEAARDKTEPAPAAPVRDEPVVAVPAPSDPTTQETDMPVIARAAADKPTERRSPTVATPHESQPAFTAAIAASDPTGPPVSSKPHKRALNFEQLLGGKVFVWIGAVALVLTGAFLLKYGYENYYVAPWVRVMLAGMFGLVLIGVAEWLRPRNEGRYVGIAQAACGAGVAVLFGTVYAGHSLYPLIGDIPAFLLLGVVAVSAVVMSLRHGPLVALLGLVGGFALPPLLRDQMPAQAGMVVYLLALELGVLAVTRKRGWLSISALTLLGSVGWSLGYALFGGTGTHSELTALLIMGTAVVFVLNTTFAQARPEQADDDTVRKTLWLSLGAVGSAVALLALLVVRGGYSGADLALLGLMAGGTLTLARIDARYMLLSWVSFGLSAVVVLGSGWSVGWSGGDELPVLLGGSLAFGLLFGLGGYAAQWWPTRRRGFVLMSALAGPVFLAVAVLGGGWLLGWRGYWWPWALVSAVMYALAAAPLVWRGLPDRTASSAKRARLSDGWAASAYALVSVGLLTCCAAFGLSHPWVAVAWAGLAALSGYVGWRLHLAVLTWASLVLSLLSAAALIVPGPFAIDIAGPVVFNTLLVVYGGATLAFAVAAWSAHRAGIAEVSRVLQGLAVGGGAVLAAVLVRDGFQPTGFGSSLASLYEWPTYAVVLLAMSLAILSIARRRGMETLAWCAAMVGLLGAALSVLGAVLLGNPLFYDAVGWPLVFGLLHLYLLPAALILVLAHGMDRMHNPPIAQALRAVSVGLAAVFALMQVRNGFHFTDLDAAAVGLYEWPTYAVVLLALSWGLCLAGRRWAMQTLQTCALAVGLAGVAVAVVGPVLVGNPLVHDAAGWSLVLGLVYLYLVPGALIVPIARWAERLDNPPLAEALRIVAVALAGVFALMQVRNGFHFTDLDAEALGFYERATYGLALFALAWALRLAGRWVGSGAFLDRSAWAVAGIGMAGTLVALVFLGNPMFDATVPTGRWLAWAMVYAYLVPAVVGWVFAEGRPADAWCVRIARMLRLSGVLLVAVFVALQVRNGFQPDALRAAGVGLFEWATYGLAWMLLGGGLAWVGVRLRGDRDLVQAGRLIAMAGLSASLLGAVLVRNPLWTTTSVGTTPVLNGLWYLYAPSIVALAIVAHRLRGQRVKTQARIAGGAAIALGFLLLSLLVRQGFSADGTLLLSNTTIDTERYAYSLAWVVFGIGLLAGGILTRLDTLRYGSLAVMLIAVGKVFALDTAGLEDLLRVFSFLGLGVTLLLLGYTYQRFVFRKPNVSANINHKSDLNESGVR